MDVNEDADQNLDILPCAILALTQTTLSLGFANNKGADQPAFGQSDQCLCYSLQSGAKLKFTK